MPERSAVWSAVCVCPCEDVGAVVDFRFCEEAFVFELYFLKRVSEDLENGSPQLKNASIAKPTVTAEALALIKARQDSGTWMF